MMQSRGVRGAITIDSNTKEDVKKSTIELLNRMISENGIDKKNISFAIFTLTSDINVDFPAKYARLECGFEKIPVMCYNEAKIEGSLEKCLRILLNINTEKSQDEIKHIYLKGAKILREDIV